MEEKEMFNLDEFQRHQESTLAQLAAAKNAENEHSADELFDYASKQEIIETGSISWLDVDITMPLRNTGELDPSVPPLPVSPLQPPSELSDALSPVAVEIALDPTGDDVILAGGENGEQKQSAIAEDTGIASADGRSSYLLGRYLADSEDAPPSEDLNSNPAIPFPEFIRSTAPIDIKTELQRFESDISEVLERMGLGDDDSDSELRLENLETSLCISEDDDGLAERETESAALSHGMSDDDDMFTLECDEVNAAVSAGAGAREISPELDAWMSKSSLVGSNVKLLAVVGGVDRLPLHGRKRKASM
ncbi:hypothetical protein Dda_0613 [Drechslerella dactyloides]|uniref:Uncharacterized protein n=1 Tax=Drechslerella dactyloides TaxID=74499 RepID=A0AAD6J613_DREDA|nr:hypothetical protein Dda_0613 [Drechslerella dactyloides]